MGTTPSPWSGNQLQLSSRSAEEAFRELREFHAEAAGIEGFAKWNYITLAPHINNDKGLLGAQKAQVLQRFEHRAVAGLELGDDQRPEDTEKNRPWLKDAMNRYRQAFFHGSDAYVVNDIGKRHTWFASPFVESTVHASYAMRIRESLAMKA